jgi:succinate dehydrogenase / fumarate reductase cytochrome b subunit
LEVRRPVFFNPLQIQMPVGALTSILHRISGVLLAASVPIGIFTMDLSLSRPSSYAWLIRQLDKWPVKVLAILLIWALAHHLFAGVRHLLSDIDIGSRLSAARRSAWTVNMGGLAVALLAAGAIL